MSKLLNRQWLIIKLIIFYCVLSSARATCTLGQNTYIDLFLSIIVFCFFLSKGFFKPSHKAITATVIFVLAIFWSMHGLMIHAYFGELITAAIPIMILFIKPDRQIELLIFLTKSLTIALSISFVAWLASFAGLVLPHTSEYLDLDYTYGVINENYFLFLKVVSLDPTGSEIIQSIARFNGFFLEPGHTGTIIAFFLIANKYDFTKWYNKVLLFILLFTLSAAAYVIAFIGYLFKVIVETKSSKILIRILMIFCLLLIIAQYNGGDNIVNNVVLNKLFDTNKGLEHRFTGEVARAYEQMWFNGDFLLGLSENVNFTHSAGYKVFILQQGLLGVFLISLSYFSIYKMYKTRFGLLFFIIVMISFLQRVYFTWDAYLDPYILGLSNFYLMERKNKYQ